PVRQIHAFDAPAAKGVAHRSRFVAVVHQHGDVFGFDWLQVVGVIWQGKAGLPRLAHSQQSGNFTGAGFGYLGGGGALGEPLRVALIVGFTGFVGPEHQARLDVTLHRPLAFGAVGIDALERQRGAVALTEQEGAFGAVLVAVIKHPVDGAHHGFGGAEVLAQGVGAGLHTQPCLQVGIDIGAPEAVNGLFRVTDHQQAGVRAVGFYVIDPVEDAVLHRVG